MSGGMERRGWLHSRRHPGLVARYAYSHCPGDGDTAPCWQVELLRVCTDDLPAGRSALDLAGMLDRTVLDALEREVADECLEHDFQPNYYDDERAA